MPEWGWVGFGYAVVYGTVAVYAARLAARVRDTRRRSGESP